MSKNVYEKYPTKTVPKLLFSLKIVAFCTILFSRFVHINLYKYVLSTIFCLFCVHFSLIEREIRSIFYVSVSFFSVFCWTLFSKLTKCCFFAVFSVCLVFIFIILWQFLCALLCLFFIYSLFEGCALIISVISDFLIFIQFNVYHLKIK